MLRRLAAVLALSLLGACGSTPPLVPPTPLAEITPEVRIKQLWQADAGAVINRRRIPLTPVVEAQRVLVVDLDGLLTAYDRRTGERIWRRDLAMRVTTGLGVGRDRLYLVGGEGRVLAVSREDGERLWEASASSEVLTPPVEIGQRLIVRSVDGRIQAWSTQDGSAQWNFFRDVPALSLRGNSSPLIFDGLLIVGLDDGRLVAIDPQSGEPVWERTLAQPSGRSEVERLVDIDGQPIAYGDSIYAGAYQGRVARVSDEGRILWTRAASTVLRPAAAGDYLFVVDATSEVRALHRVTGVEVWRQDQLRGRRLSAPEVVGKHLVVGDLDGYVHWLDQADGRLLGRFRIDEYPIVAPPVARDGDLYVHTQGGTLAALRPLSPQP